MQIELRSRVAALLREQGGVVARTQLLDLGSTENDVRRLLRRRELVTVHEGVYVDHTGPLTWHQRAWAGVLALAPAALCHESALRADDGPGRRGHDDGAPVHVAVGRRRSPAAPDGVRLHHLADLEDKVRWNLGPPRVRIEHAVLDIAAESRAELDAVATLADAVGARRTTAARIQAALATRSRIARRSFIAAVLADVEAGTCSVLEHGYLTRVERPHGLPGGQRQLVALTPSGRVVRDLAHPGRHLLVELDGRSFHSGSHRRDADLERDLDAAVAGDLTIRLGWGQVFDRSCRTAIRVARLLQRGGWSGSPTPCPQCRSSFGW